MQYRHSKMGDIRKFEDSDPWHSSTNGIMVYAVIPPSNRLFCSNYMINYDGCSNKFEQTQQSESNLL